MAGGPLGIARRAPCVGVTRPSSMSAGPRPAASSSRDCAVRPRPSLPLDTESFSSTGGCPEKPPKWRMQQPHTPASAASTAPPGSSSATSSLGSPCSMSSLHSNSPLQSPGAGPSPNRPQNVLLNTPSRGSTSRTPQRPQSRGGVGEQRLRTGIPQRSGEQPTWNGVRPKDRHGPVRASLPLPDVTFVPSTPTGVSSTAAANARTQSLPRVAVRPPSPYRPPSAGSGRGSPLTSAGQVLSSVPAVPNVGAAPPPPPLRLSGLTRRSSSSLVGGDDEDFALQDAICDSLEAAENERRLEEESIREAENRERERKEKEQREHKEEETQQHNTQRMRPLPPCRDVVRTFGPFQWLSDASIAFVYSLFDVGDLDISGCKDKEYATFSGGRCKEGEGLSDAILLIDPATAFWLTVEEDPQELDAAKRALKVFERELVLCPINDNRDGGRADAGTHWSLLVCWRPLEGGDFRFTYYDSLGRGQNLEQAETLAGRLIGKSAQVTVRSCAQQTNTFDCGVYVILFSEIILKAFLEAHGRDCVQSGTTIWDDRLSKVTPKQVADHRASYHRRLSAAAACAAGGA